MKTPTIYTTPSVAPHPSTPDEDFNRAITIKMGVHEAALLWQAFAAFGRQPPPHFDSAHPMRKAYELLETIRTAVKVEHPDCYEHPFSYLPPINPPRHPAGDPPRKRPTYPPGVSHYSLW